MTHSSYGRVGLRPSLRVSILLILLCSNLTAALVPNAGQSPLLAFTPSNLSPAAPSSAASPAQGDLFPSSITSDIADAKSAPSDSEYLYQSSSSEHPYRYREKKSVEVIPTWQSNSDVVAVESDVSSAEGPMKAVKTKLAIGVLSTLISYVSLNSLARALNPQLFVWSSEDKEDAEWTLTSKSWVDRKVCRWLGVCGFPHIHTEGPYFGRRVIRPRENETEVSDEDYDWQHAWTQGTDRPEDWTDDERVLREIPDYVLEHAPLVHLYSEEQFWPCDIAEHLYHVTPTLNYTPLQPRLQHPSLQDLDKLNEWDHARHIFLTSEDDVEERPDWLEGEKNIPIIPGRGHSGLDGAEDLTYFPGRTFSSDLKGAYDDIKEWFQPGPEQPSDPFDRYSEFKPWVGVGEPLHAELKRSLQEPLPLNRLRGGRSEAPAVLIAINKGHGIVDAFWFFFYSFNLGNTVFNVRFGNHVGDWEHSMIRFHNGKPKAVFFSEHNFGSAYGYEAVEKIGKRPVIYSAKGSHAMYSTPGLQPYILPWGILHDITDRGPLWDPVLNSHSYTYDYKNGTLRSSNLTPEAPTNWFHYSGHWGDKFYPLSDARQYRVAGQYHYVNGPIGPKFKNLGRRKVCGGPDSAPCVIKHWLGGLNRVQRWQGGGEGQDLSVEDLQKMIVKDLR